MRQQVEEAEYQEIEQPGQAGTESTALARAVGELVQNPTDWLTLTPQQSANVRALLSTAGYGLLVRKLGPHPVVGGIAGLALPALLKRIFP